MQNYYVVLGVPRDASKRELARAYRRRAVVHHRTKVIQLEDHLNYMAEAYATLADPERRAAYDAERWGYPAELQDRDARDRREGRVRVQIAREMAVVSSRTSALALAANAERVQALATEHDLREARDRRARRRRDLAGRAPGVLILLGLALAAWLALSRLL
jgi:DnaJ-class molecular chaperone